MVVVVDMEDAAAAVAADTVATAIRTGMSAMDVMTVSLRFTINARPSCAN